MMKNLYDRVLLISIDALGRKHSKPFEQYFNKIYTNYRTTNTWTLPSHLTMLSGFSFPDLYERLISVYEIDKIENYAKDIPTIASDFKKIGFKTRAITGGGFMSTYFGWGKDWNQWIKASEKYEWIGQKILPSKNEFLFLHTFYVHNWFDENEELMKIFRKKRKTINSNVDRTVKKEFSKKVIEMAYVAYKNRINKLFKRLSWLNELPKTILVILTSDHGELFKEDGTSFHHGHYAMESPEIFDVPLMMKVNSQDNKYIERKCYYDIYLKKLILNETKFHQFVNYNKDIRDYIKQMNKLSTSQKIYIEQNNLLNSIWHYRTYKKIKELLIR